MQVYSSPLTWEEADTKESDTSSHDTPGREPCSKEMIPHHPHIPCMLQVPVWGMLLGLPTLVQQVTPALQGDGWASLRVCWWPHQHSLAPIT